MLLPEGEEADAVSQDTRWHASCTLHD